MGIISRFVGTLQSAQPIVLHDPAFGRLRFHNAGFWEGKVEFAPLKQQVKVLVHAAESGPTQEQRQWLEEIGAKYVLNLPRLIDSVWPQMLQADVVVGRSSPSGEMELDSIGINTCDQNNHNWEMVFFCEKPAYQVTVAMLDWRVENVQVKG